MFIKNKETVRERKDFNFKIEVLDSDVPGSFEGYASVFNIVDEGGDVVEQGAFTRTLNNKFASGKKSIPLLWQHDSRMPMGMITEAHEDNYGLFIKGQIILGSDMSNHCHALMKAGAISGMSIGYDTMKATFPENEMIKGDAVMRRLQELRLWEISMVTFPMNDSANVTDVKGMDNVVANLQKAVDTLTAEVAKLSVKDDVVPVIPDVPPLTGDSDTPEPKVEISPVIDNDISPDGLSLADALALDRMLDQMTTLADTAKQCVN